MKIKCIGYSQALVLALLFFSDVEAVKTGRLSDKLRDLSSTYPETRVLENKLTKMVRLQPSLSTSLSKIDRLTDTSKISEAASSIVIPTSNAVLAPVKTHHSHHHVAAVA